MHKIFAILPFEYMTSALVEIEKAEKNAEEVRNNAVDQRNELISATRNKIEEEKKDQEESLSLDFSNYVKGLGESLAKDTSSKELDIRDKLEDDIARAEKLLSKAEDMLVGVLRSASL